jgi:cytochrome d ubiquinol oxidase subunit I
MSSLDLARLQFGTTSVYHFFFVPLTIGLSILVAVMETAYVRTGNELYRKMTRFWGHLFLINFALGVVTGIVQEFQFGMNWSTYARFVGNIFGVPLAIEALLAFFIESTFLGVWIFTWDRLPKHLHAGLIWLVALGSNLSALWILIANAWMQHPVGYRIEGGVAVLTNIWAVIFNPQAWYFFAHTLMAGLATASFLILGVSAYHLLRKQHQEFMIRSMKLALVTATISSLLVAVVGHGMAQYLVRDQPMKMAAAEAIWHGHNPTPESLFAIPDQAAHKNLVNLTVPLLGSVLAYNRLTGEIPGIEKLEAQEVQKYGPGNYIPPVALTYWSFRIMVGLGGLMVLASFLGLWLWRKRRLEQARGFYRLLIPMILAPYLANTFGWFMTEFGRQPWIVQGLMTVAQAVSPSVPAGEILFTWLLFTLLYGTLMALDVMLLARAAKAGPEGEEAPLGLGLAH